MIPLQSMNCMHMPQKLQACHVGIHLHSACRQMFVANGEMRTDNHFMANVTVSVPKNVLDAAQTRLGGRGRAQIREYLKKSLISLAQADEPLNPETIEQLRAARRSGYITVDDIYWQSLISAVRSSAASSRRRRSA